MARKYLAPVGTVVAAAFLTGCVTTGGTMSDSDETRLQGAGVGAILGGAIGALACKDDRAKCALIGAGVGAVAGGAFGHILAKRKESYRSKEEAIAEEIAWHQEFTRAVHAENQQRKARISSYRREIAQLQKTQASQQQVKASLAQKSQNLDADLRKANQQLAEVNASLTQSRNIQNQYGTNAQLRQEIAKLEEERKVLTAHIQTMNAMNNSLGV